MARVSNHLVIMAGGVGSRFWPMSTADRPKQFIDILGVVVRFCNLHTTGSKAYARPRTCG